MDAAALIDLPPDWELALAMARDARRIVVLGPTDVGKSSFIRALAERRPQLRLIDLDPGQKMIGPPGTASIGPLTPAAGPDRIIFLGSTAVGSFRLLADAAADLAATIASGFVVNTAGYVQGPGARLQQITLAALEPDLVVSLATPPQLEPALAAASQAQVLRLAASPCARRKSAAARRAIRQAAFDAAFEGAATATLPHAVFEPAPPARWEGPARPVCALADAAGEDMVLAILMDLREDGATVFAPASRRAAKRIRLGKMWAEPGACGWRLLDKLSPAWSG